MIETLPLKPIENWQSQLRQVITTIDELLGLLQLQRHEVGYSEKAAQDFPMRVPLAFVQRMRTGDPEDPLLLQVLARADELQVPPEYTADPVGECGPANPQRGIIHKYQGRVLLMVASSCAINCRYCFRRHFPYEDNQNSRRQWREALSYIAAEPTVEEVILSGGDPLIANDRLLAELVAQIAAIPHIRRLRIHSRLPVVLPDRVTKDLLNAIVHPDLQTVMVIHSNHSNEIDSTVRDAVAAMRSRDITVLNQAVLLRGVNDDATSLVELSEKLFAAGVLPYYLHLLDKVAGAAHFDLLESDARGLMGDVSARLPGYLVPRLVREEAGAVAKTGVAFITG